MIMLEIVHYLINFKNQQKFNIFNRSINQIPNKAFNNKKIVQEKEM